MNESAYRPAFGSSVIYREPKAALTWLEAAFGFEVSLVFENEDGFYSEMTFGEGYIMVGGEWSDADQLGRAEMKSPESVGGQLNTQSLNVRISSDIDAHCERARAAGAVIVQEPADQPYGARTYRVVDPEGHEWGFAQQLRQYSPEKMRRAGLVIERETGRDVEARTFEAQPFYADVKAALSWLGKALGFETTTIIESAAGGTRAHVAYGDSMIAPASEWVDAAGRRQVRKSRLPSGA